MPSTRVPWLRRLMQAPARGVPVMAAPLLALALLTTASAAPPSAGPLVAAFKTDAELAGWQRYSDVWAKGNSSIEVSLRTEGSGPFAVIRATHGDKFGYPFVGLRKLLVTGGQPVDMSDYKGLRIRLRGEQSLKLQLLVAEVTDFNEFSCEVSGERGWKTFDCPYARFAQSPFFGRKVTFTPANVRGVQLHLEGIPGGRPLELHVGEISFYK